MEITEYEEDQLETEEPQEYHYTTEREELEDRGMSYSDFI